MHKGDHFREPLPAAHDEAHGLVDAGTCRDHVFFGVERNESVQRQVMERTRSQLRGTESDAERK